MFNAEKFFSKNYIVVAGALICCMLWGSAFPCVKLGYSLFGVDQQAGGLLMTRLVDDGAVTAGDLAAGLALAEGGRIS